jgi:hypothetical protein
MKKNSKKNSIRQKRAITLSIASRRKENIVCSEYNAERRKRPKHKQMQMQKRNKGNRTQTDIRRASWRGIEELEGV